jgi:hypothetical protein
MIGHLRQITPAELKDLQSNPNAVRDTVHGETPWTVRRVQDALQRIEETSKELRARAAGKTPAERQQIRSQLLKELAAGAGAAFPYGPDEVSLSLEKSWHVLHYLLTGEAEEAPPPLGNAILGGTEIGGDLGYGPARFLSPQQVREVAAALATISKVDLAKRFDLDAMIKAHIYPCRDEDELEMAQHHFEHLSPYYADAAKNGNAMLLYII